MFGSNILEIATGIIFVFILVSTICTAIREGIEAKLKTRAAYLERGIRQLLHDMDGTGLAKALYNHPLIYGLFNGPYQKSNSGADDKNPNLLASGGTLPSYIPAKSFAAALIDIAAKGITGNDAADAAATTGAPVISLESMRKSVASMANPKVQQILLYAIDNAQGDINKVQTSIEDWYNSGMDRVSGWYKRSTQWIILWIALVVTIGLNVNTIKVVNYLAKNDTQRKMLVATAESAAKDTSKHIGYQAAQATLDTLKLPIGWTDKCLTSAKMDPNAPEFNAWNNIFGPMLGWLITAFAATLGAPFWFDMLNKVMIVRSTIKPGEKSGTGTAGDQPPPQAPVINITNTPPPPTGGGGTPASPTGGGAASGGGTTAATTGSGTTTGGGTTGGLETTAATTATGGISSGGITSAAATTTGGAGTSGGAAASDAAIQQPPPPPNDPPQNPPVVDNSEPDGCDVTATVLTGDADLPESIGGMK